MPKSRRNDSTKQLKKLIGSHLVAAMEKEGAPNGAELAERVGVTPQTVADWRSGRTLMSLENLLAVAGILNESVSFLVGDSFHGVDSLEVLGRRLAARLGHNRLVALTHVSDEALFAAINQVLGSYVADHGPTPTQPARQSPKRSRRRK